MKCLPSSRVELKAGALAVSPSSTSDPRSSSVALLFEEFVPSEYRSALAAQGNKPARNRLPSIPSLLSPNKHKTHKQAKAATFNGRIGSSNRREAEFERLIAGGGNVVTKVLTLDTARAKGAQPRAGTPLPADGVGSRTISGPLMTIPFSNASAPALQHSPINNHPAPPLPHKSPASQKVSTPTTRRSRFKFPGAGGSRQGMLIPSEYDTVDFETRLASYSDDELNDDAGRPQNNKAKRLSRDDAWVDILVASNSKRMTGQDAELRQNTKRGLTVSGGSGGRSDPELASQEVAQALAAVRQLPQTDDEGDGGWDPRRVRPLSAEIEDLEPVSAPPVVPKPEEKIVIDEGEGESTVHFPQKKRLGYFDLHPERLPNDRPNQPNTDASDAYSADYRDSIGHSFTDQDQPYDVSARSTTYSEEFEPTEGDSLRLSGVNVEPPAFIDVDSAPYTSDPVKPIPSSLADSPSGQGKTAALIEIYRERERQQQAQQQTSIPIVAPLAIPPKPSRLPVRASSLPQQHDDVSPPLVADVPDDSSQEDFPITQPVVPFVPSELGRASPQRYVHGAPLHNVLEEEEE